MAIKFTSTKSTNHTVKCVIYGASGVGKTTLAKTCPKPLIISSEHRLLSLSDANIPVILIEDHNDLMDAYAFVTSDRAKKFETVVLDSISDIAETILTNFKENPEDGNHHKQAAYGSLADKLLPLIKKFRDIPGKHVFFIAKSKLMKDEYNGITTYAPSMPGQVLAQALPYLFDFVLPMRIGETEGGKKYRYLQTEEDLQYIAKECSNNLSAIERPHLGKLFEKILKKANVEKTNNGKDAEKERKENEKSQENQGGGDSTIIQDAENQPGDDAREDENIQSPGDFDIAD